MKNTLSLPLILFIITFSMFANAQTKISMFSNDVEITVSKDTIELLIEKGFDPIFGARPLKRTIQRLLEDPLAEEIISGKFKEGSKVEVERKTDDLVFHG